MNNRMLTIFAHHTGMWRLFISVLLALLCACNTPDRAFQGVPATRLLVDGSIFDVRVRDRHAEAIRINPQYAPRLGPIGFRAATAMQQVSGCVVVDIKGDAARITARLDCGKGAPPRRETAREYECIPLRGTEIKEIGQIRVELDCDAV
ncbi:MAG: hypothetical protein ABJL67_06690 [Sulfitobacter sp.]